MPPKTCLFTPDLINFWLTGEKGNEITMASTSQMLNQSTRAWDFELLDRLNLPTHMLGELWEPGHLVGTVRGAARIKFAAKICPYSLLDRTIPHRRLLEFLLLMGLTLPTLVQVPGR